MKLILPIAMLCFIFSSRAQNEIAVQSRSDTRLFAQCMFSIPSQSILDELTVEFYNTHPEIEMVRFDMHTQRALLITTGISNLSEADFTSWFGKYSATIHCVQIGVYGIDKIDPYPFTNCNN
ncbi:hypothetical protein N9C33_01640 [Crocinitomicaceae bacterium]|nr:hypothetical protein [Crocinitomicaceae bacterium]